MSARTINNLAEWLQLTSNTAAERLIHDGTPNQNPHVPREVQNAHLSFVKPAHFPNPFVVATSTSCADVLQIPVSSLSNDDFRDLFIGAKLDPPLNRPYATVYGCHCYGYYFGQLGDGRAITLGEVTSLTGIYELQLKGAGPSPYSRMFDGRAVLRSCIREFLASEHMHFLRVPTTRALTIISTGESLYRPWYPRNSMSGRKAPPQHMMQEPGAVMCRVASSFHRFGHLELHALRKEYKEMKILADYIIDREYSLLTSLPTPKIYIEFFREVTKRCARLVVEWMRVGYVQGNMNSDNTSLAGLTIDYGPFAFMERYDPRFQPFTSDREGKFSFSEQPRAMAVNIATFGDCLKYLVRRSCVDELSEEAHEAVMELKTIADEEYWQHYRSYEHDMICRKLGVSVYSDALESLWVELGDLMNSSGADYTLFFRLLQKIHTIDSNSNLFLLLQEVFYVDVLPELVKKDWIKWMSRYRDLIKSDVGYSLEERKKVMCAANPKYILRNWMAAEAYEKANEGDMSVLHELQEVLCHPYEEQSLETERKYFTKTPVDMRNKPGVAFLS